MTVGLKVDFLWYSIGTGDFFHSFFSTICVNLENGQWGSRYPVLMMDLYQGVLPYDKLDLALDELSQVGEELKSFPPNQVVWDIEDRTKMPPWGNNISSDIRNLSDYFVTSDGQCLISVLKKAFNEAQVEQVNVEVKTL